MFLVSQVICYHYFSCIFEAKASRGDFLSTFNDSKKHKNRKEPIANLHWCVAKKGVCEACELPDFWGLLLVSGVGLSEKRKPKICLKEKEHYDKFAHQLIWPMQKARNRVYWQEHEIKQGSDEKTNYISICHLF